MNYSDLLNQAKVFNCLANGDPFEFPLEQRGWDDNIGDHHVWNVIMNEFPYLFKHQDNDSVREWTRALQFRLGISPRYFKEIERIIKQIWGLSNEKDIENIYHELVLFLRQYAYLDPEWIQRNTYRPNEED